MATERTNLLVLPVRAGVQSAKVIEMKAARSGVVEMNEVARRKVLYKGGSRTSTQWTPDPLPAA